MISSVAFLNSKGGAGKSTASINFAVAAYQAGQRVLLIDIDPQRSCARWAKRRTKRNLPVIAAKLADVPELLNTAEGLGYSCVAIDTAGHDARALAAVSGMVDLSVIVVRPTRADVEVAMAVRSRITGPYAILLSQTPPVLSARLRSWRKAAAAMGTVVDVMLGYRMDFQDSFAAGAGVTEWAPSNPAAHEVRAAFEWIWGKLREESQNAEMQ
jgi:chromosome partitioning protein